MLSIGLKLAAPLWYRPTSSTCAHISLPQTAGYCQVPLRYGPAIGPAAFEEVARSRMFTVLGKHCAVNDVLFLSIKHWVNELRSPGLQAVILVVRPGLQISASTLR